MTYVSSRQAGLPRGPPSAAQHRAPEDPLQLPLRCRPFFFLWPSFAAFCFPSLWLVRGRLARHCTRAARGRPERHCTRARRRDANRTADDGGDTAKWLTAGGTELETAIFGVTARDAQIPPGAPIPRAERAQPCTRLRTRARPLFL